MGGDKNDLVVAQRQVGHNGDNFFDYIGQEEWGGGGNARQWGGG
jgi:hypothetical protein